MFQDSRRSEDGFSRYKYLSRMKKNENNKRKDINENRENTKNKINQRIEQSNVIKKKKTKR